MLAPSKHPRQARGVWRRASAAALVVAMAPAAAQALPGDPPIGLLTPADGATVATNADGIAVSFSCPPYGTEVFFGTVIMGSTSDYVPRLATDPAVGSDGRLAQTIATGSSVEQAPGTCVSTLGNTGFPRPQSTPGTYYWQVARNCLGCTGGYEVSPVARFELRADTPPTLSVQSRGFVGFPIIATIRVANPQAGADTTRTVQRLVGSTWRDIARERSDGPPLVRLPRGTHSLRAAVTIGTQVLTSTPRTVRIVQPAGWTTGAASNGRYRDPLRPSVKFRVTANGRRITAFAAEIPTECAQSSGSVLPNTATLVLPPIAIAPDGRFAFAAITGDVARRLTGRLVGTRVVGTTARFADSRCAGSITVGARRTGP